MSDQIKIIELLKEKQIKNIELRLFSIWFN